MTVSSPPGLPATDRACRAGFVMEQTLGHVTHYTNLRAGITDDPALQASWFPIEFAPSDRIQRLPLIRDNWSVRASWQAWRTLTGARARDSYDALFFHTQVTTLFSARLMRAVPSVVSLDATPINYDAVGVAYGHRRSAEVLEGIKRSLNARSLQAAAAIVTWCDWAKQSLVDDYGLDGSRISVIAPGVDLAAWPRPETRGGSSRTRILFVGGDFERKGGEVLLRAFEGLPDTYELHLVTKAPVDSTDRIHVYHDVAPNSQLLKRLYATAELFVLPTLADCFPLVIQEAMAAGLPVISTDTGAIREAVRHGETGLLAPPGDAPALRAAILDMSKSSERSRMGRRGRDIAERDFDSAVNARRIAAILRRVAGERKRGAAGPINATMDGQQGESRDG